MAFHRTYLVDPDSGLDIQIKNFTSFAGQVLIHDVGVVTITMPVEAQNSPTGADAMHAWLYPAGSTTPRVLRVFTLDESGAVLPQETFFLTAAQKDEGEEASDTYITFTGYYCSVRLQWADLPFILPGGDPYPAQNIEDPLTADEIIAAALAKIQGGGNLPGLTIQVQGTLPPVVLDFKPSTKFLDFLNGLVSSKSIAWRYAETRTAQVLTLLPYGDAGVERDIEFNRGSAINVIDYQVSNENVISRLTVVGKNAHIWRGENEATSAALGTLGHPLIKDKSVQRNDLYTQAMTDDWGTRTLAEESQAFPAYTLNGSTTKLLPSLPIIGKDFNIGDTVWAFFDGTTRYRLRVEACNQQITDSGRHVTYSGLQLGRSPRDIVPIKGSDPASTGSEPTTDVAGLETSVNDVQQQVDAIQQQLDDGTIGGDGGPGSFTGTAGTLPVFTEANGRTDLADSLVRQTQTGHIEVPTLEVVTTAGGRVLAELADIGPGSGGVPEFEEKFFTLGKTPVEDNFNFGVGDTESSDQVALALSDVWLNIRRARQYGATPGMNSVSSVLSLLLTDYYYRLGSEWDPADGGDGGNGGGSTTGYTVTPSTVSKGSGASFVVTYVGTGTPPPDGTAVDEVFFGNVQVQQYLTNEPVWQAGQLTISLTSAAYDDETSGQAFNLGANYLSGQAQIIFGGVTVQEPSTPPTLDTRVQDDPDAYPADGSIQPHDYTPGKDTVFRFQWDTDSAAIGENAIVNINGLNTPDCHATVGDDGFAYITITGDYLDGDGQVVYGIAAAIASPEVTQLLTPIV